MVGQASDLFARRFWLGPRCSPLRCPACWPGRHWVSSKPPPLPHMVFPQQRPSYGLLLGPRNLLPQGRPLFFNEWLEGKLERSLNLWNSAQGGVKKERDIGVEGNGTPCRHLHISALTAVCPSDVRVHIFHRSGFHTLCTDRGRIVLATETTAYPFSRICSHSSILH